MATRLRKAAAGRELRRLILRDQLYAVIDACDQPHVPQLAEVLGASRVVSLYRGLENEDDWATGAYVLRVDRVLLDWLQSELPADSWGILIQTTRSLEELLAHLQQFVFVEDDAGDAWLFRFYDPRVLGGWLTSSTPIDRAAFLDGLASVGTIADDLTWWVGGQGSPPA